MLTSPPGEDNNYTISNKSPSLSRLSSLSSSTSSSSPSPHLHYSHTTPKSMEEVWKDINLSSLHHNSTPNQEHINHNSHFIFQDFLARPFDNKDPPTNGETTNLNNTPAPLYASSLPPPATVLSLNSTPGFDFLDTSHPLVPHNISSVSSFATPFHALASSSTFGKKRVQDSDHGGSVDRRQKRMIKNRESAARSRARKQAYTNELELEVSHLLEENARLKRQQEQLCLASAAQLSKRNTLQRTSTAPF
ncbi:protein FD [Carica papaya]|uniref:protein FD n=1 Tax=Carica papaya TaxID=3649 RepID=UPI000B8CE282|nr:protein FD [Carica papaya]